MIYDESYLFYYYTLHVLIEEITIMWKIIPTETQKKLTEEAPSVLEREELETLMIAFTEILKRQKIKCGIDEVLNLVQDFLEKIISKDSFDKS